MKCSLVVSFLFVSSLNAFLPFAGDKMPRFQLSQCRKCFEVFDDKFRIEGGIEEQLHAKLNIAEVEALLRVSQEQHDLREYQDTGLPPADDCESKSFIKFLKLYKCFLEMNKGFADEAVKKYGKRATDCCSSPLRVAVYEYQRSHEG